MKVKDHYLTTDVPTTKVVIDINANRVFSSQLAANMFTELH